MNIYSEQSISRKRIIGEISAKDPRLNMLNEEAFHYAVEEYAKIKKEPVVEKFEFFNEMEENNVVRNITHYKIMAENDISHENTSVVFKNMPRKEIEQQISKHTKKLLALEQKLRKTFEEFKKTKITLKHAKVAELQFKADDLLDGFKEFQEIKKIVS